MGMRLLWVSRILFVAMLGAAGFHIWLLIAVLTRHRAVSGPVPLYELLPLILVLVGTFFLLIPGPYFLDYLPEERRRKAQVAGRAALWTRLRWALLGGDPPRQPWWGAIVDAIPRLLIYTSILILIVGRWGWDERKGGVSEHNYDLALVISWQLFWAGTFLGLALFIGHTWLGLWGQREHTHRLWSRCRCGTTMLPQQIGTRQGTADDVTVIMSNLTYLACPYGHTIQFIGPEFVWALRDQLHDLGHFPISRPQGRGEACGEHCRCCKARLADTQTYPGEVQGSLTLVGTPPFQITIRGSVVICPRCGLAQLYADAAGRAKFAAALNDTLVAPPPELPLDPIGAFLAGVVNVQPEPPRRVPLAAAFGARREEGVIILGMGGLFLLFGFLIAGVLLIQLAKMDLGNLLMVGGFFLQGFLIVGGFFLLGLILINLWVAKTRELRRALALGTVAKAEVLGGASTGPSPVPRDGNTFAGMENGLARGQRRITLPNGDKFEDTFKTDRPWVRWIHIGTHMIVLVDPQTRKVLYDIGLEADPFPPPELVRD